MATVEKHIKEETDKIKAVKNIVKKKAAELDDSILIPASLDEDTLWKELEFAFPERNIRIGTMFSGIGAIEHAFQRLKLNHTIVFAGDIDANCKKSYFANYEIQEEDWFTDDRFRTF